MHSQWTCPSAAHVAALCFILLLVGCQQTAGSAQVASALPQTVSGVGAQSRGEYLTALLGCGQCHTEGALLGNPQGPPLAGSQIGIAYTAAADDQQPGVVFPKNLTPDKTTGLGGWSRTEVIAALQSGRDHAGQAVSTVMPWMNYSLLAAQDAAAIADYLLALAPVKRLVPANIAPGQPVHSSYIRIGIYVFKPSGALDSSRNPAAPTQ